MDYRLKTRLTKILELYGRRKDEALAALAIICGNAELLLQGFFDGLNDDQRKLAEQQS